MRVQYVGKGERTVGTQVVYPGELLEASPVLLAAWQAEHGDVFVVVGAEATAPTPAPTPVPTDEGAGDPAGEQPAKARRR